MGNENGEWGEIIIDDAIWNVSFFFFFNANEKKHVQRETVLMML